MLQSKLLCNIMQIYEGDLKHGDHERENWYISNIICIVWTLTLSLLCSKPCSIVSLLLKQLHFLTSSYQTNTMLSMHLLSSKMQPQSTWCQQIHFFLAILISWLSVRLLIKTVYNCLLCYCSNLFFCNCSTLTEWPFKRVSRPTVSMPLHVFSFSIHWPC